jgi:hypothetical protein
MKFIVIDGVKYKVDPNDSAKALLDAEGKMVLYVEEVPPVDPENKNTHEYKMKNDPDYARVWTRNQELEEAAEKKKLEDEEARTELLKKNGEFQTLAEEAIAKRKEAEELARNAAESLKDYKKTLNGLLDDMKSQIPEDKKSLIPTGNSRTQIDYIRTNAKFLGVSIVSKGGNVPPNEDTPPLDEEGKLNKEYTELLRKENLSFKEKERMGDLARMIKQLRARKS